MLQHSYFQLGLDTYLNNCSHNLKRISNKLDKYLEDPNDENIHHMRTSLRRFEASYYSSPKKIRKKKKINKYAMKGKQLFKINSEIRDIDIILEKLLKDSNMSSQQLEFFEKILKNNREHKLQEALTKASDLKRTQIPESFQLNKSKDKAFKDKLMKRLTKVKKKFMNRINTNTSIVINDSSKVKELHELRKDAKKLRYIIELILDKDKRDDNKNASYNNSNFKESSDEKSLIRTLEHLEDIQKFLGDIHDYDITIDYLKKQPKDISDIPHALNNLEKVRNNKFKEYVDYMKTKSLIQDIKLV